MGLGAWAPAPPPEGVKTDAPGLKEKALASGLNANLDLEGVSSPTGTTSAPAAAAEDGWLAPDGFAAADGVVLEDAWSFLSFDCMTSSDCLNSSFRLVAVVPRVPPSVSPGCGGRDCCCLKFIQSVLVLSSSFGNAGSRFRALMRFISDTIGGRIGELCAAVIMPRLVLCSSAKPSPSLERPLLCRVRLASVRFACSPGLRPPVLKRASAEELPSAPSLLPRALGTELNFDSSSSSSPPRHRSSSSACWIPLSISLAIRSAFSRFSLEILLGSSFVV
mmetsp:Transcript_113401/g.307999  ORF Transcript_113401/g.307999 Transcript_113401/m.307999 type:complete len:277 (+) Transcript_113401:347-1177(+)